jgi:hypothetical protein
MDNTETDLPEGYPEPDQLAELRAAMESLETRKRRVAQQQKTGTSVGLVVCNPWPHNKPGWMYDYFARPPRPRTLQTSALESL